MRFPIRYILSDILSLLTLVPLSTGLTACAEVRLAAPFGSNMVLQAAAPLRVWGRASPGEEITVQLGSSLQRLKAGKDGSWSGTFDPLQATHHPVEFHVSGKNSIRLSNVVVGEVWIAAGQSNMQWPLELTLQSEDELRTANRPSLRLRSYSTTAHPGAGAFAEGQLAQLAPENYLRGEWRTCSSESAARFSAVAYYFAKRLQESLECPVGILCPAVGGTPTEAWVRREAIRTSPDLAPLVEGNWIDNELLGKWCRKRAKENLSWGVAGRGQWNGDELGPYHPFRPGYMWEAAMAPLSNMSIRGVIWYQGESNADSPARVTQHRRLFEVLAGDWRRQFRRYDLPLLFVQLPSLDRPHWPAFRQSQLECSQSIENTGMVVTIDVGHPTDVHPSEKRPVGERLAKLALGEVYDRPQHEAHRAPVAVAARRRGRRIFVEFERGGRALELSTGDRVHHIEVARDDKRFFPADAQVESGGVVVRSTIVEMPTLVRYAWRPYPSPPVNLFNSEGLPASPFELRVDDQ